MRLAIIGAGVCIMLAGAAVLVVPWYDAARWQASPQAARAERNANAPTPVWLTPTPVSRSSPTVAPRPAVTPPPTSASAPTGEPRLSAPVVLQAHIEAPPTPTPTPSTSDLRLGATAFTFDDPPEPGAHARLTVSIENPTDAQSGRVTLALPTRWLAGYRLQEATPAIIDGNQAGGMLRLSFDGPNAASDLELSLEFVTTDEVIDAPELTVLDAAGRMVGQAHPATQAPPPRPGPIYSIDIPRLKLHAGVVPVDWEPPLFVVGQLRTSAYVTQGNSVLVGHLRGAAGYNVFDHLDQLQVGDEIVAHSRGAAYTFTVSQTEQLPEDDTSPTGSTTAPRLTLMTCAGEWNPITRDYSDRLWVLAAPKRE